METKTRFFSIVIAALCALIANASGQTVKSLSYNTTNGNIVATTNVVWTNAFSFITNTVTAQVRTNLALGWPALTNSNAATTLLGVETNGHVIYSGTNTLTFTNAFTVATNAVAQARTNLGLSATWLTNDNVTNFRTAIGLGATNDVSFNSVAVNVIREGTNDIWDVFNNTFETEVSFKEAFSFIGTNASTARAATRTNLGLGLPALTNTSNVTMMRALAGSTDTNQPFSGTVEYHNHNADPFFMEISNGIILRIYE